jgi:hypothetical protein
MEMDNDCTFFHKKEINDETRNGCWKKRYDAAAPPDDAQADAKENDGRRCSGSCHWQQLHQNDSG